MNLNKNLMYYLCYFQVHFRKCYLLLQVRFSFFLLNVINLCLKSLAFYSCFIYNFVIQVISEKTLCSKGFTSNLREIFTWKLIVTIIPADLVTNLLLSSFCPFLQTKNKILVFSKLVVWWREIFLFFVYSGLRSTSKPCRIQ